MRIAAFDIGTNTILMLVADVEASGSLRVVRDEHTIARMGKGVDKERRISEQTLERVEGILQSLLDIAKGEGCERIVAGGTSALRDAGNRDEVVSYLRSQLGLEVWVLTPEEEAQFTFRGTVSGSGTGSAVRTGVIDIGGGSTELMVGSGTHADVLTSLDIGAVRLTERWWNGYPASPSALENAGRDIRNALKAVSVEAGGVTWLGVAGTPTTLAAMALGLAAFGPSRINGHVLTREFVERSFDELSRMTLPQLRSHPQIHPDRADIIVAGTLILREIMRGVRIEEIGVSVRGLRFGMALEGVKSR